MFTLCYFLKHEVAFAHAQMNADVTGGECRLEGKDDGVGLGGGQKGERRPIVLIIVPTSFVF